MAVVNSLNTLLTDEEKARQEQQKLITAGQKGVPTNPNGVQAPTPTASNPINEQQQRVTAYAKGTSSNPNGKQAPTPSNSNLSVLEQQQQLSKPGAAKQLPMVQDGQPLPIVQQQPATPSNNVLELAKTKATQNATQNATPAPDTMQQAGQKVQNLLNDPTMGYDYNKANKVALENYDANRSKSFEASRQQMADIGNAGVNMEKLYKLGLQGNLERSTLDITNQTAAAEAQRKAALDALTASGQYEQVKAGTNTSNINNLLNTSGAEEGDKNRQFDAWKTGRMEEMTKLGWDQEKIKLQMDIESKEKMNQLGIGSQEKIAFAGLNLEQQKVANQAMQFNSSLDWEKSSFAQSLSQEDKKLIWQATENEKVRLNDFELAKFNLAGQKELKGIEISAQKEIQNTLLAAQKEMQKTGIDAEAQQKQLDRLLTTELQKNNFKNSKEMQGLEQSAKLELAKFDATVQKQMQDDLFNKNKYMQLQGFSQEEKMAKLNSELQQAIDAKKFEQSKEFLGLEQSGKLQLQSLDAGTQKEIQANLLKATKEGQDANIALQKELQKNSLAQEAMQFKTQQEFDTWALNKKLSQEDKILVQQTLDKKLDREHEMSMQTLQQQFEKQGMDYKAFLSQIDKLSAEAQAEAIKDMAINSGVTYKEANKVSSLISSIPKDFMINSNTDKIMSYFKTSGLSEQDAMDLTGALKKAMVSTNGNKQILGDVAAMTKMVTDIMGGKDKEYVMTKSGLKPTALSEIDKQKNTAIYQAALKKYENKEKLTDDDLKSLKTNGTYQSFPRPNQENITKNPFIYYTEDARGSTGGKRAYRFTDDVFNWLEANGKDSIVKGNDGNLYKIQDYWEPGESDEKMSSAYIVFEDLKTGKTIKMDRWNQGTLGTPIG